jgi:hypothetical protein
MQEGLVQVLSDSAAAVGLHRADWLCQPAGDGELAILAADEPEDVLVDDYVRELTRRLDDYNEDRVAPARLRLRMAIHHGIATPAANGYAGAGVVVVSRLVECAAARAAQAAAPDASLVLIISNRVFLDTVAQGHTALRDRHFRKVAVQVKEYVDDAWLYVPGHDVHSLDLQFTDARPAGPAAPVAGRTGSDGAAPVGLGSGQGGPSDQRRYRAEVINEFKGPVSAAVIGINQRDSNA